MEEKRKPAKKLSTILVVVGVAGVAISALLIYLGVINASVISKILLWVGAALVLVLGLAALGFGILPKISNLTVKFEEEFLGEHGEGMPSNAKTSEVQQVAEVFCTKCGTKLPEGAGFCPKCGKQKTE